VNSFYDANKPAKQLVSRLFNQASQERYGWLMVKNSPMASVNAPTILEGKIYHYLMMQ